MDRLDPESSLLLVVDVQERLAAAMPPAGHGAARRERGPPARGGPLAARPGGRQRAVLRRGSGPRSLPLADRLRAAGVAADRQDDVRRGRRAARRPGHRGALAAGGRRRRDGDARLRVPDGARAARSGLRGPRRGRRGRLATRRAPDPGSLALRARRGARDPRRDGRLRLAPRRGDRRRSRRSRACCAEDVGRRRSRGRRL